MLHRALFRSSWRGYRWMTSEIVGIDCSIQLRQASRVLFINVKNSLVLTPFGRRSRKSRSSSSVPVTSTVFDIWTDLFNIRKS